MVRSLVKDLEAKAPRKDICKGLEMTLKNLS